MLSLFLPLSLSRARTNITLITIKYYPSFDGQGDREIIVVHLAFFQAQRLSCRVAGTKLYVLSLSRYTALVHPHPRMHSRNTARDTRQVYFTSRDALLRQDSQALTRTPTYTLARSSSFVFFRSETALGLVARISHSSRPRSRVGALGTLGRGLHGVSRGTGRG